MSTVHLGWMGSDSGVSNANQALGLGTVTGAPLVWNGTTWAQGSAITLGGAAGPAGYDITLPYSATRAILAQFASDGTTTRSIIDTLSSGGALRFGQATGWASVIISSAADVQLRGATHYLYDAAAGVERLKVTTTEFGFSLPLAGNQTQTVPLLYKEATYSVAASNVTLTAAQYTCPIQLPTGASGASRDIVAPANAGAMYTIYNATNNTVVFKVTGQTGVSIATTKTAIVRCNGTDYVRVTADA